MPPFFARVDIEAFYATAYNPPHRRRNHRANWSLRGYEEVAAEANWTTLLQVLQDRFSDFMLNWELLRAIILQTPYSKGLIVPIEIGQSQIDNLARP